MDHFPLVEQVSRVTYVILQQRVDYMPKAVLDLQYFLNKFSEELGAAVQPLILTVITINDIHSQLYDYS